jgi:hypothetical protein
MKSPDYALRVNRLHREGKDAEAVPIAERMVDLVRGRHGEDDTRFASALNWLAFLYDAQGRL